MDAFILATLFFAFGFPILLMFAISRLSGWSKLAARYPSTGPAPKALTLFGYGSLRGWIGYNGGLILAADDAGLYLSTWPVILSWCHEPVFIPWSQLVSARARRSFWTTYYGLSLRGAPEIDFALRAKDFNLVRPFLAKAGVPVVDLP